jgi:uncharacterized integral membrane protein
MISDNSTEDHAPDTSAAAATSTGPESTRQPPAPHRAQRTRASALWVSILLFTLVLLLLLVFILENSRKVDIAYFGAHTHLPLGVALLLAAVCGILLVAIPGTGRILQLRATTRRRRA